MSDSNELAVNSVKGYTFILSVKDYACTKEFLSRIDEIAKNKGGYWKGFAEDTIESGLRVVLLNYSTPGCERRFEDNEVFIDYDVFIRWRLCYLVPDDLISTGSIPLECDASERAIKEKCLQHPNRLVEDLDMSFEEFVASMLKDLEESDFEIQQED